MVTIAIIECKYMKHIFELRMKDQIEERNCLSCVVTARIFPLFDNSDNDNTI